MRHSLRSLLRVCAALVLGSLVGTAAATYPARDAQDFNLKLRLEETIIFTGAPPCFGVATLTGRGWASDIGEITAQSQDCVNPKGTFDPSAIATNAFVFTSQPTTLRITTGNGDLIFMTYSGTLTPRRDGLHRIRGHFVITGGTGRFAQATGGGMLTGSEDLSQITTGRGTVYGSGTITY